LFFRFLLIRWRLLTYSSIVALDDGCGEAGDKNEDQNAPYRIFVHVVSIEIAVIRLAHW